MRTAGGPIIKDKAFFFGGYQRVFAGFAGSSTTLEAPTAAGIANLNTLASSDAVRNIIAQFPVAASANAHDQRDEIHAPAVTLPVRHRRNRRRWLRASSMSTIIC